MNIKTDHIRAQLLKTDTERKLLICFTEENPVKDMVVRYDIAPENRAFTSSVERFREGAYLNLIDCVIDDEGFFIPNFIILEPDYLIDASAIAECFQDFIISPLLYFRNKFEEKENRSYLLLGNLANFFLDELVFAENPEEVSFNDVFLRSFKQSPFEYTSCDDIRSTNDFRLFMDKARRQFENIKRVIQEDFPRWNINLHDCTLEPSFFCERYGFQGRLDLLQPGNTEGYDSTTSNQEDRTIQTSQPIGKGSAFRIVELKSGRLPYPSFDRTKVGLNHEVQTAVYRLMIETVFGKTAEGVETAILYSAGETRGENLRTAKVNGELEKAILNIRNHIVANEQALVEGDNSAVEELFNALFRLAEKEHKQPDGRPLPDFFTDKLKRMQRLIKGCSEAERVYFFRFVRFVARELYHQKIGDIASEVPTGTAALWNSAFSERADALDVLFDLSIMSIDDHGNDMTILFSRNRSDNQIVNFREGEICIVYPRKDENDTVLNRQILKGTIVSISAKTVAVRFRYKQKNRRLFEENALWAIEHDSLDSSYNAMYKGLYAFLNAPVEKKHLLMGVTPPQKINKATEEQEQQGEYLTNESNRLTDNTSNDHYPENIIRKAMVADDYFLIVGPPGTGKTSVFARRLIEEYHAMPDTNIMVLAYTNRAVDELCEAINAAFGCKEGECDTYIRVGTELSCAEPFRHRLLQRISEKAVDRESLRQTIERTRIYVATLASINGRMELFKLKHFNVAIIDEASQILEPQIIGLLPQFDRFIMIGDHNQLSTIVLQDKAFSTISEPSLRAIGFTDCRDSLFERLLRHCQSQGWSHAYAQLSRQGRMHEEIATFPATHFYSGQLYPALKWQSEEWKGECPSDSLLEQWVAAKRTAFFSTEMICRPSPSDKTNETEAALIVDLLSAIRNVYAHNGMTFHGKDVGIIAPYRNQIALIKNKLDLADIPDREEIMIDTVERYQGSQRDVILISLCANKPYQMEFLCNPGHDGTVDRKLNVAITRARKQLFMVGNAAVLRLSPIYATLIDHYSEKGGFIRIEKGKI